MNKEDVPAFKEWLASHLKIGPVQVKFVKKDGSERTMNCTLNEDLIPKPDPVPVETKLDAILSEMPKAERKVPEGNLVVYDIDSKGWRSFIVENVKEVKFDV